MLASFLKKSEPFSFIAILLLLLLLVSISIFTVEILPNYNFTLYYIGILIYFTTILIILSFVISINNLTPKNYYALFIFVILIGLFPETISFSKITFSHLFILLASRRLYGLQFKKESSLKLFDSGFFIGIAFLFYPISVLYLILLYAAYFYYIKNIEKELFIPVFGFLTPLFLTYTYFLVFDQAKNFITLIEFNLGFDKIFFFEKKLFIPLIGVGILLLYALYSNWKNLQKGGIEKQKNTKLIFIQLLIGIVVLLLFDYNVTESILFLFSPIAVSMGNMIDTLKKKWIKEILLWGLLISAFISVLL